jgi:signal transduction histidine kinase
MSNITQLEERIEALLAENQRLMREQLQANQRHMKEIKQASEELHKAQEAAQSSQLAKANFLGSMSHELRTPLNTVLGFCQVLLGDQSLSKSQRETVLLMMRSGEQLLALINDILELSKIETSKLELQASSFDLYQILDKLSAIYQAKAEAKGLDFETEFAANLPRFLFGDYNKLRQILLNLLGNAVKYTEDGGIIFRAWSDEEASLNSCHLFFEVRDTGLGIPEENLDSIFELFSERGKNRLSGAGLGLYISREFARLMRGDVEVETTMSEGSSFVVDLYIENAEVMLDTSGSFLEHVARAADGRDKFHQLELRLAALPLEYQGTLHDALIQYSLSSVELVCREIANFDSALAQEIVRLAKEFEFKTILNLLPK